MSSSVAGTATSTALDDVSGHYDLDVTHSRLGFVARHAMVTKVRGSFTDFAGSLDLDASTWPASRAQVTIQVASIDTGNEQRDGHLRTNDFFDAPNHPQITFTSTRVEQTAEDTFAVTGDLTIKGTTKDVEARGTIVGPVEHPAGGERIGIDLETTVDRTEFGLNWNAPMPRGGFAVENEVTLTVHLELAQQE